MQRRCDNCNSPQGPFISIGYGKKVCKVDPKSPHTDLANCKCRMSECVKRRAKIDFEAFERPTINNMRYLAD